jgi:hypothetical protein
MKRIQTSIQVLDYMDNGVLLETKTLVELICHYIRDQMRVFSVFHACEWHTKFENFPPFSLLLFWKYKWSSVRIYNEINVGNKTKTLKRHLEISKIYFIFICLHYNLKNIAFILVFRSLFSCRLCVYFCHYMSRYGIYALVSKIHISSQPSNIYLYILFI